MTNSSYSETIVGNCRPLTPEPTGVEPRLTELAGIRAVLFDVYGTLLISASGDVGANAGDHRAAALRQTCELLNLELNCPAEQAVEKLHAEIARDHAQAKAQGVEYPEVDIVEAWQAVVPQLVDRLPGEIDWQRLALEYEVRVNPVWPMPTAESTLAELAARELVLGIVSNAQFFTPLLFPALMGKTVEQFGFEPELSYFSYEYRQAKPGSYLYGLAQQVLESREIQPAEVLYVGNDMLNDVTAAASVGFRTALFAGDRRSLRLRSDDDRVQGVAADIVMTQLSQLLKCLA